MSEFQYTRASGENIEYGTGIESPVKYVANHAIDAAKLIADLMASAVVYDWPTLAGSNRCTKMELSYCKVTENRYHDYLPRYCLSWKDSDGSPKELYSDDFMDIVHEIMRRWW